MGLPLTCKTSPTALTRTRGALGRVSWAMSIDDGFRHEVGASLAVRQERSNTCNQLIVAVGDMSAR